MPAGSGPSCSAALVTSSIGTSEVAVLETPASNWNSNTGNLISAVINYNASGAQTLTVRVRQGAGTGGALVGSADAIPIAGAGVVLISTEQLDTSAFAQSGQGQQYTVTLQSSITGPGTVNRGVIELETTAPVQ